LPHLAERGAKQTELQLKGNVQLKQQQGVQGENNNSSDHPAQTGRPTSPPNYN
jgi:hypothetical protein